VRPLFLLFQLSARLTRRTYLTSRGGLLALAVALLAGLPYSARFALELPRFLEKLSEPHREWYLTTVLGVLFLGVALSPAAGGAALAGHSDSRLRLLPVRPGTLAGGLVLGSLADPMLLPVLPPLIALLSRGALALILLALCALALGQLLLRLRSVLFAKRRVREGLALVGPILAALVLILASRPPARAATSKIEPPGPAWQRIGASLPLTPPGLAARALTRRTLLPDVPLALWAVGLLGASGFLLSKRVERESDSRPARRRAPRPLPFLPPDLGALVQKELSGFSREPFFRGGLGKLGLTTALLVFAVLTPPDGPGDTLGFLGTGLLAWTGVWMAQLACNQLGPDFTAGALLLSFPMPRWRLLLAKNLALGALFLPLVGGVLLLYGLAAKLPLARTALFVGYGALWAVTLLGLGSVLSVLTPYALIFRRGAGDTDAGASQLLGLVQIGVASLALVLALQVPYACPLVWALGLFISGKLLTRRDAALSEQMAR
jgi:hypothetical protein